MANLLKHISKKAKDNLFEALNYMKMTEIKEFCHKHSIPSSGKKGEILERIKQYLTTGQILLPKPIPDSSKAKAGKLYVLAGNAKILKGAYKNDLATRKFFKKMIGEHFHFTSYGQDWILKHWLAGKPPAYAQFAKYWQKEYLLRKKSDANPKKEWAYLNFIKKFKKNYPSAKKNEIAIKWEQARKEYVSIAKKILDQIK